MAMLVLGIVIDFLFIFLFCSLPLLGNAAPDFLFKAEERQVIDVMPLENGIWDISSSLEAIAGSEAMIWRYKVGPKRKQLYTPEI